MKLKYCLADTDSGAWGDDPEDGCGVPVLRSTEIDLDGNLDSKDPANRSLTKREISRTRLARGDLLVVRSSGSDAHLGKTGYVGAESAGASFSNFLQRLRLAPTHNSRFAWYFMNSTYAKQQIRKLSSTTTGLQNLSAALIGELEIPSPSLEVQRRIADFLDAKTARIDTLGQKLRHQIFLLEMRRQIQITDGVRGSDSDTQRSLHAVAEVILGRQRAPQHAEGPYMVPYLRAANVKDGSLDLSDVMAMNFTPDEQRIFALRPGDVLVTEGSGSLKAVGAAAVWTGEMFGTVCFQNTLLRIRPRPGLADGKFLEWWARSTFASGEFASIATGANIYHLSAERVRSLLTRFPNLDEQRRIADHLAAETNIIDRVIATRRRQTELLAERRQALITAAVTGQFDVSTASGRNVTDGVSA